MRFAILNDYTEQIEAINPHKPVLIYRNLRTKAYSISQGRVRFHAHNISLYNVTFIVRESVRQRVCQNKRKEVHAFIKGYLCSRAEPTDNLIYYNPYKTNKFLCNGEPIDSAELCNISLFGISVKNPNYATI